MQDYKPNSHRFREEQKNVPVKTEKKIERVVDGAVKTKKKSEMHKLAEIFIAEDIKNVKSYILMDVIVPTIKKTILSTIDMILNGGNGTYNGRSSTTPKVSYRKYYEDSRDDRRPSDPHKTTRFDYDEIIFNTRGEAEAVRSEMEAVIDTYGLVTVADLYDMVGLQQPYTSNKYGWMNIRTAEPVRVRDGYVLKLPKAVPID